MKNRNITDALQHVLDCILNEGEIVVARGQEQREVLASLTKIARPEERFLVMPGRKNNVFAQLAETAWVLAGRNDLEFLSHYLPRAVEFSDDGKTWRAAYGPRIRRWGGHVDQVAHVINRLQEDPNTKRAVISIFDPGSDFTETKDVPCNNWLQFIQRNGRLDLHVTVRANDAIWGFSGINFFEWSVLHEIVARSLDWEVGSLSWYVGTFHIYERHYSVAQRLSGPERFRSPYEFNIAPTCITTTFASLDETLSKFFEAESFSRRGDFDLARSVEQDIADPFFRSAAIMVRIYNARIFNAPAISINKALEELGNSDFLTAAIEYLSRKDPDYALSEMLDESQRMFFEYYAAAQQRQLVEH